MGRCSTLSDDDSISSIGNHGEDIMVDTDHYRIMSSAFPYRLGMWIEKRTEYYSNEVWGYRIQVDWMDGMGWVRWSGWTAVGKDKRETAIAANKAFDKLVGIKTPKVGE
jgi:hypothetical protein